MREIVVARASLSKDAAEIQAQMHYFALKSAHKWFAMEFLLRNFSESKPMFSAH